VLGATVGPTARDRLFVALGKLVLLGDALERFVGGA
jgi:hypothetical protein